MPTLKIKKPCNACPWKKDSVAGWLGDSSPKEFMAQTMSENAMPCHCQIDYDDPDWRETQLPDAPLCGGALVFLRNICKVPRDPILAAAVKSVEADRETVFSRPDHFIEYHNDSILKK